MDNQCPGGGNNRDDDAITISKAVMVSFPDGGGEDICGCCDNSDCDMDKCEICVDGACEVDPSQLTPITSWQELKNCDNPVQNPDSSLFPDGCSEVLDNPTDCGEESSFRPACIKHDKNYQKCNGNTSSWKATKKAYDKQFHRDMMDICKTLTGMCRSSCTGHALDYYYGVRLLANSAYKNDQIEGCSCCNE